MIKTSSNDERQANFRKMSDVVSTDRNFEKAHLKAYLSGAKRFKYHGKYYAVKYELLKVKQQDA